MERDRVTQLIEAQLGNQIIQIAHLTALVEALQAELAALKAKSDG